MTEVWRPIPGYVGAYDVSNLGRVRSVDRVITRMTKRGPVPARLRGRVLRTNRTRGGYLTVTLGGRTVYVHALVLSTFVGPRPAGKQAAHWDGDRSNNRLGNLRWASPSENNLEKARHGTLRQASCRRGHRYTPDNTKLRRGRRVCRTCLSERRRRYRQARRDEMARRSGTHR
jgi:NUMOD4 motif-containing protein/HNH endonuclease